MGSVALFCGILGLAVAVFGVVVTAGLAPKMGNLDGMTLLVISIVLLLVGVLAALLKRNPDY